MKIYTLTLLLLLALFYSIEAQIITIQEIANDVGSNIEGSQVYIPSPSPVPIPVPSPYLVPYPPKKPQPQPLAKPLVLINEQKQDRNKQVSGIIITISNGRSYDQLFQKVKQKSKQGTRVLVYQAFPTYIDEITQQLLVARLNPEQDQKDILGVMIQQILKLSQNCKSCIVFNWECSSGYSSNRFPEGKQKVMNILKVIIEQGYIAMFSDFSLKALIHNWDSVILGDNPFIHVSETSSSVQLYFNNQTLSNSPSLQLQTVSELAEDGKVLVRVLGGTIVYDIDEDYDSSNETQSLYDLQILTSATRAPSSYIKNRESSDETIGHALLKYKTGGYILTSMVHWIQLMRINTSAQTLFRVAEKQLGTDYVKSLQAEYNTLDEPAKKSYIQQNALLLVQNASPGSNSANLN